MSQERLTVRKIREIIRLKWESKLSNRAISRACKVSNSTVGEYVRRAQAAGIGWPLPSEMDEAELYRIMFPERTALPGVEKPLPNWEEVKWELSRDGVTLKLLWMEYIERYPQGYKYTQFCEHYRRWCQKKYPGMRRLHKAGEEMEVDYAGTSIAITNPQTGEVVQAHVFVAILPASNYLYAEVQSRQDLCCWINGHVRALQYFGGVARIFRPDNLKAGVKSPHYYEPEINPSYQEMAEYYHAAVLPARVGKPKDKASVENGVQNVERWVIAPLRERTFFSIAEANRAVWELLDKLNQRVMGHVGKSRRQLFEQIDRPALRPLPERPFEFALWKKARVNIDYHVAFDKHFYSVPHPLIHEEVEIRATERLLEVFHRGKRVAVHPRSPHPGRFTTRGEHMPSNHRFVSDVNADWLMRSAGEVGPQTLQMISALLKSRRYPQQAYRSCLGILSLAKKHNRQQLENACQVALEAKLLSYQEVKAELSRLEKLSHPNALPLSFPAHENIRGDTYYH